MEQLTEFVAKSFVDSKPPAAAALVMEQDRKESTTCSSTSSLNAAHMISNILSTMPQMSSSPGQWPLAYPFPLFGGAPELNAFHSKLALNSMVERFSEIQHHLNRTHQLHYPASMLYNHKTSMFPLIMSDDTSGASRNQAISDKDSKNSTLETSECKENSDSGESLRCNRKHEPLCKLTQCKTGHVDKLLPNLATA